jgi:CHASE3 domain sensor protein
MSYLSSEDSYAFGYGVGMTRRSSALGFFDREVIIGGLGIAMVLLAGIGSSAYWSIQELQANQAQMKHTQKVLDTIHTMTMNVMEAELGRGNFLMSKDPNALSNFDANLWNIEVANQDLRQLLQRHPEQLKAMQRVTPLLKKRLDIFTQSLALVEQDPEAMPAQMKLTESGGEVRLALQQRLTDIQDQVEASLQQQQTDVNNSVQSTILMVGAGYVVSFGLLLGVYWLLYQEVQSHQRVEDKLIATNQRLLTLLEEKNMPQWLSKPKV